MVPTDNVAVVRREALDLARSLSLVTCSAAPARAVVTTSAADLLENVRDLAAVLTAAEQLGVAEQAVADAVAFAKEREQFGRAIGSFQAIKHLAADMATDADLARSLVEHAVWAAVEAVDSLPGAAASALVEASRSACSVTADNVQIHGGIGFSWEHPAHLYFRKARSNQMLWGDSAGWSARAFAAHAGRSRRDRHTDPRRRHRGRGRRRLAGGRTCVALRQAGHSGPIVLIGAETHPPYDRPPLSKTVLASPETGSDLDLDLSGVDLRLGVRATGLDPAGRIVRTDAGTSRMTHWCWPLARSPWPCPGPAPRPPCAPRRMPPGFGTVCSRGPGWYSSVPAGSVPSWPPRHWQQTAR